MTWIHCDITFIIKVCSSSCCLVYHSCSSMPRMVVSTSGQSHTSTEQISACTKRRTQVAPQQTRVQVALRQRKFQTTCLPSQQSKDHDLAQSLSYLRPRQVDCQRRKWRRRRRSRRRKRRKTKKPWKPSTLASNKSDKSQ